MKYVTPDEMMNLIKHITHGRLFSIQFNRALPKCEKCGCKSKKWIATHPETCPKCGGKISYDRWATAQTGVHNPQDKSIAPKGVGETFAERRARGIIGFYDINARGYRECRLENIKRVAVDGEEYVPVR